MEVEVPEIFNGTVEIKAIAREAGSRSKVAVAALQPGVDPVGSCVGMRGVRIQHIVNELNGEKIDVVAWSPDEATFIGNALSPAKAVNVILRRDTQTAIVVVPDRQLSLAIGKEGQNARLAAKLTGWRIDIKSETEAAEDAVQLAAEEAAAAALAAEKAAAQAAAKALLAEAEAALAEDEEQPEVEVVAEAVVEAESLELESAAEEAVEVLEAEMDTDEVGLIEPALEEAIAPEVVRPEVLGETEAEGEPTVEERTEEIEDAFAVELRQVDDIEEEVPVEQPVVAEAAGIDALEEPIAARTTPPDEWYVESEDEDEDGEGEDGFGKKKVKKKGRKSVTRAPRRPGKGRGKLRGRDWLEYDEEEY
jgi:N utilization substance protein A